MFLAGVSISFQRANGKPLAALTPFLLKHGLWLVFLEATVMSFGFNFGEQGQQIGHRRCWHGFLHAPCWRLGVAILAGYSFVVSLTAGATGIAGLIRILTIAPGAITDTPVLAYYAFVPWLAMICLGFGLEPLYRRGAASRDRTLPTIAASLLGLFIALRLADGYGDPVPLAASPDGRADDILVPERVEIPSPARLCAGDAVDLAAAVLGLTRLLLTFGRTPLFTYLLHIYIAHSLMLLVALGAGSPRGWR